MRKIFLKICILLTSVSAIAFYSWFKYGIFSEYNYFVAKRDITNGKIQFIEYGLPTPTTKEKEIDSINLVYGFRIKEMGCICSKQQLNSSQAYNETIEQFLNNRNGDNWRTAYKMKMDSLEKLNSIFDSK